MDATTSIGAIPKLGRFGLIIHFILIYSLSLWSFNKFSLRISSKISITAFFYFAGLLRKTFCLVFVLESFSIRGNFNVMLSWVTTCKRAFFTRRKTREKRYSLFALLLVLVTKKCFTKFSSEISHELLETTLLLGILSQKSSSWSASGTFKYISQKIHNFKFIYICIWNLSRFWFLEIPSVANLNSRTRC